MSELNKYEDRCDSCGAQAFFRVWVPVTNVNTVEDVIESPEKELLFCGHHASKFELDFEARGWRVDDFRDQLNTKPSASANVD